MKPITLPNTANRLRQDVEDRKRFIINQLYRLGVDDSDKPFNEMTLTELEPIYIREKCLRGKEIE
jgi:hypothetical protein